MSLLLRGRADASRARAERRTHLGVMEIWAEAILGLTRRPGRSLLCALGTIVAVGAFVAISGLTDSASGAVSAQFNSLRATTVYFQTGLQAYGTLTAGGVQRLRRVHGVRDAGLIWGVKDQEPLSVAKTPLGSPVRSGSDVSLEFTAASPSALTTIGAQVSSGRLYDDGATAHHQLVCLLGSSAAAQLNITSVLGAPAIFVDGVPLTVVGIIGSTQQEGQVLLGVVVPPYVASLLAPGPAAQTVITTTTAGAAQLVGREGPDALAPYTPGAIDTEVPPSPTTLQASIQASLKTLLVILESIGLVIGLAAIATVTTLAVTQRRSEIGLRRSLGYQRSDIAALILLEAASTGVLGSILGTSLGVLAVSVVAAAHGWEPTIATSVLIEAPLAGVAIGLLAGGYPALRAAAISPIAALRSLY